MLRVCECVLHGGGGMAVHECCIMSLSHLEYIIMYLVFRIVIYSAIKKIYK